MAMFLPNSLLFVEAKPDPLFWVKIFVSAIVQVCEWTPHGMKRFTTHHKLILEIDEPEADQFFGVQAFAWSLCPPGIMVLLISNART